MAYINQYMELLGMTRKQLSEKSGVSPSLICRYVNDPDTLDNADWDTRKRIAEALDITVHELHVGKDYKTKVLHSEIIKATEHLARLLRNYASDPMYLNLTIFTKDAEAKDPEDNCEGLPDYYAIRCHEANDIEGIVPTISESSRVYYKTDDTGEELIDKVFKYSGG